MTNILLAALVAAFLLAFAAEVARRRRRDQRSWLDRLAEDVRRGFVEGYRGVRGNDPRPAASG